MKLSLFSKSFLIILFVAAFFSPSLNKIDAQETCSISSVSFTAPQGDGDQLGEEVKTTLKIESSNCQDNGLNVQIIGIGLNGNQNVLRIDNAPGQNKYKPEESTGSLWIEFNADEAEPFACDGSLDNTSWGYECVIFAKVFDATNGDVLSVPTQAQLTPSYITSNTPAQLRNEGILVAECDGGCDNGDQNDTDVDNWKVNSIPKGSGLLSGNCIFSNEGASPDVYFTNVTGESFTDQIVRLNIKTKDKCDGLPFQIILEDYFDGDIDLDIEISNLPNDTLNIVAPNGEDLYVDFKVNEDGCNGTPTDWDCTVYVDIEVDGGGYEFETEEYFDQYTLQERLSQEFKDNVNLKKGVLAYECQTLNDCREDGSINIFGGNAWQYISSNGEEAEEGAITIQTAPPKFDRSSPCFIAIGQGTGVNGNGIDPTKEGYSKDCYEFLAPIPGFTSINSSGENNVDERVVDGQQRIAIKSLKDFKISDYINSVFQIALGILMVLSVIMIVIAGVQYMTTEAIFQKQVAKEYITKAVFGLILGLGIFIILNTINPRLLEVNFGENIAKVSVEAQDPASPAGTINAIPGSGNSLITTKYELPQDLITSTGISCPGNGGKNAVRDIALSFDNKVTYRFGGKGGHLPEGKVFYDNAKNYQCNGERCGNFCPEGSFCIDCSGFVSHVLQCAGLTTGNLGGTGTIFENNTTITSRDLDNNKINNRELQPGDLLGYVGHVIMYIGNGDVIESVSGTGTSGRQLNQGIKISKLKDRVTDKITRVRFID